MEITGIKAGNLSAGKISSKKEWKLMDFLREKVTALAKEDAARYMVCVWSNASLAKDE